MSVRRLAQEQPASFAFTPENVEWAKGQIAKYPAGRQASAVIPLLWRAQKQHGYWLPRAAIELVAQMLGMQTIRVMEVATFYTMFNLEPVGKHFIQLCGTVPCHLVGAHELKKVCEKRIGPQRQVTPDGVFAWLEVECLGACCNAPMAQINDDYYEDLTVENFNKLLDDLAAGRPVKIGSQTGRVSSESIAGKGTTLSDPTLYDGSRVGQWQKRFEEEQAREREAAAKAAAEKAAAEKASVEKAPVEIAKPAATPVEAPAASAPASGSAAKPAASPEAAALAEREEAEIKAKLATLAKDASPEDKANAVGSRPQGLTAPRAGKADDLQRIKGIGPVNEGKLNGLGMFHFDQIAGWSREEIRWVGTYLSFPGRIDREAWTDQAKALAAGKAE